MNHRELMDVYHAWDEQRDAFAESDGEADGPRPGQWQASDDRAVDLLHALAGALTFHHPEDEPDNEDRALFVRPLVEMFAAEYNSSHLEEAIRDIIADLGHLYDRLGDDEQEFDDDNEPNYLSFESAVASALANYDEEVREESESD